jgi:septum site-determining protein MinC
MSIDSFSTDTATLKFKSATLTVPVLLLTNNDLVSIEQQLQQKIAQAPEFFKKSPLLIDFQQLTARNSVLTVKEIIDLVRSQGFMPIGIQGGTEQQNTEALEMNLPIHALFGQKNDITEKKIEKTVPIHGVDNTASINQNIENKLISHPIRSGQRVYAKGDLIVTATVSAGAEIMAEGNIHVYGSLRGKALAGVQGNTESRIFCFDLQAELISIAGVYQLRDDLSVHAPHKPLQISLENQKLIIKDL